MLPPTPLFSSLKKQQTDALARLQKLEGVQTALATRKVELTTKVANAKARVLLQPEIDAFLQALQLKAHERSAGVLERLLTAIVGDVLTEDQLNIALTLGTERGLPALDISVKKDKYMEDIYDGNGGALTNIISAGLRFAALAKSGQRKFIVMDEPDCWLEVENTPNFTAVIEDVATQAGIQTLYISHHDLELFAPAIELINLTAELDEDGFVTVKDVAPSKGWAHWRTVWDQSGAKGIRSIQLKNFQSHVDTTVPLYPGVTGFLGPNNKGKSAVSRAFRAVGYNESSDTYIRHNCSSAEVIITLEDGKLLKWVRKATGAPKVAYTLLDKDGLEEHAESGTRGEVPDWVSKILGISKIDSMDVQVGEQKLPVFLLDESASTRASILSVGNESAHLAGMLQEYKNMVKDDKQIIKSGEQEISGITSKLDILELLDFELIAVRDLDETVLQLSNASMAQEQLSGIIRKITEHSEHASLIKAKIAPEMGMPLIQDNLAKLIKDLKGAETKASNKQVTEVKLDTEQETVNLANIVNRLKQLRAKTNCAPIPQMEIKLSEYADNNALSEVCVKLIKLSSTAGVPLAPEVAPIMTGSPLDIGQPSQLVANLIKIRETLDLLDKSSKSVDNDNLELELELDLLKEQAGNICPICHHHITELSYSHEHTV